MRSSKGWANFEKAYHSAIQVRIFFLLKHIFHSKIQSKGGGGDRHVFSTHLYASTSQFFGKYNIVYLVKKKNAFSAPRKIQTNVL